MTVPRSLSSRSRIDWLNAGGSHADHAADRTNLSLEEQVSLYFHELNQPVFRYLVNCCRDRDDAEELQQEAFLRLYSTLKKGEQIENVRSWVFRVARNLMLDRAKHQDRVDPKTGVMSDHLAETLLDPQPTTEQHLVDKAKMAQFQAAVDKLAPQQRECVLLRCQNLTYREIGEILGMSPSGVASAIARAKAPLKKAMHA